MGARIGTALWLAALLGLTGCGVAGDSDSAAKETGALPPADDVPEPGLQGQVPIERQADGLVAQTGATGSPTAWRRGTRPVGSLSIIGEPTYTQAERGGNFEMAWLDDCAYVGVGDLARQTANDVVLSGPGPELPATPAGTLPTSTAAAETDGDDEEFGPDGEPKGGGGGGGGCEGDPCHPPDPMPDAPGAGLAIISAKNPATPTLVYIMQLRITPRSPSVGGPTPEPPTEARTVTATANPWEALQTNAERRLIMAGTSSELVLYQAVYNCKYPSRRSVASVAPMMVHGLRIAPDGMTAWVSDANADGVMGAPVLAALDLANVREPKVIATFADPALGPAGVHGIDVSADGRRAYVAYSGAGLLGMASSGVLVLDVSEVQARAANPQVRVISQLEWDGEAHSVRRARAAGRDLLLIADIAPMPGACPWGQVRIIDIADEAQPAELATVALAVNDPANCMTTERDLAVYSPFGVSVDDPDNTQRAFFSWVASGLRVFDLADPAAPQEVAYYNPPANPDTLHHLGLWPASGLTWDATLSSVRYRPDNGQIWFASVASGFHIVEFTRSMGPGP